MKKGLGYYFVHDPPYYTCNLPMLSIYSMLGTFQIHCSEYLKEEGLYYLNLENLTILND